MKPFVAGSIGSWGAYLPNGEEFTGAYDLTEQEYIDFHRQMIKCVTDAKPDILAFETFPRLDEVKAICKLLKAEFPEWKAYVSF
jgi:homocysteine S-methyltransferase